MPNQRIYLGADRHGQGYWLDPDGPSGGYVYYHEWSGRVAWVCTLQDIVVDLGEVTIILSPLG